jgi:hypothetical protein
MAFDNANSGHRSPKPRIKAARASRPNCDLLEPRLLLAGISGIVFEDNNGDGIRGGADFAMTLKYVYLDTNNNGQPDSAETGTYSQPSGYSFTNLAAGTYNVRVVVPLQYRQSAPANDAPLVVTVAAADNVTGKDIGLTTTLPVSGSIQGYVFADGDANGIRDGMDQPLPGTKIYADINGNDLLDAGEPYVTPDVGGSYKLRASPGTYNVRAEFPQDYIGSAPSTGFYTYTFKVGLTGIGANFGAYGFGKVSGSVFDDADGDGFKSGTEPPLAGRTVYADVNFSGAFEPGEPATLTSATGNFTLSLRPGTYTLRQVLPVGWIQTAPASDPVRQIIGGLGGSTPAWGAHLVFSHPVAGAGGSYEVFERGAVTLTGTAESPLNRAIVAYEWDFDYDFASFDVDATGPSPTFSAANIVAPASRLVGLRVRDSAGELSDVTFAQVSVIDPPPSVISAQVQASNNRATVNFSEDVGASLLPTSFAIVDQQTGSAGPDLDLTYDPITQRAALRWAQPLTDGNYRLYVWSAGVRDDQGQSLRFDYTFDFFVLGGDANQDRAVDFLDLAKLAQNYNTSGGGKTYADGDFNGDDNVDFLDLAILAQRYNTRLLAPGASQPSATASSTSFAADWAAATASVTAPVVTKANPKKVKPKPIFSITPVVKPVPVKPRAQACRHR